MTDRDSCSLASCKYGNFGKGMGITSTDELLAAELFGPVAVKCAPRRPVIAPAPLAVQQWMAFIASWWWLNILIEELPVRIDLWDVQCTVLYWVEAPVK